MKELRYILAVNWYLYSKIEIKVVGNVAFTGANGAGKSSLIDAIQAVLLGGSRDKIKLNANTGGKSKRTLREYCLGVVIDQNDKNKITDDMRARDDAITHLVLVFEDTVSGEFTSIGLSMTAQLANRDDDVVCGKFIIQNYRVQLDDLLEQTPAGDLPRTWEAVKERLGRKTEKFFFRWPNQEHFMRKLGEVMCHDGSHHIETKRFIKNFQNAITFAPIADVSHFVRFHILEGQPLDIDNLKGSMRAYQELSDKTRQTREQIDELAAIEQTYADSKTEQRLGAQYRWIEAQAKADRLDAQMLILQPLAEEAQENVECQGKVVEELRHKWQAVKDEKGEKQILLATLDVATKLDLFNAQKENLGQSFTAVETELGRALDTLASARLILGSEALLPAPFVQELKNILPLLPVRPEAAWPTDPEPVMEAVRHTQTILDETNDALLKAMGGINSQLEANREKHQTVMGGLDRLRDNKVPLAPNTVKLQKLLADAGILSNPLCDLIDVQEDDWRMTVECILGSRREALIVDPSEYRRALLLYRREGKRLNITRAKLINTTKTQQNLNTAPPNTLAQLIDTDNAHARAFINFHLGRVVCVETEAELEQRERAATKDGMVASGQTIERNYMDEGKMILGRNAVERQRRELELQSRVLTDEHSALLQKQQAYTDLNKVCRSFFANLPAFPNLAELINRQKSITSELAEIDKKINALDTRKVEKLKKEIEELGKKELDAEKLFTDANDRMPDLIKGADRLSEQLKGLKNAWEVACDILDQMDTSDFDPVKAAERLAKMCEAHDDDFDAIEANAARMATERENRFSRLLTAARDQLINYLNKQSRQLQEVVAPSAEDFHTLAEEWVKARAQELRESTLADYEVRANEALEEAKKVFRTDFVIRLREDLQRLEQSMAELNGHLKGRVFHGKKYTFTRTRNPEYTNILNWIDAIDDNDPDDSAATLVPDNDNDSPHAAAMQQLHKVLLELPEDELTDRDLALADYRNYYNFDVEMTDEDGMNPQMLNSKLKTASGGETQSPFYVAIGAALAATYRIRKVRQEDGSLSLQGGMNLIVFDEAFSKMDQSNSDNALKFLKDLGLQVILAAPDDKHSFMSSRMETVTQICRYGGAVDVLVEYPTEKARELLSADMPEYPEVERINASRSTENVADAVSKVAEASI